MSLIIWDIIGPGLPTLSHISYWEENTREGVIHDRGINESS